MMDIEAQQAVGERIWLQPGEKREYSLEIGILEGADTYFAFLQSLGESQYEQDKFLEE